MESFRYPSGGPSVRACPSLLVWGRAGRPLQTQLSDQLGSAKSAPALQIIKIRWNPSGILPAGRVSRPASVYWFEEERGASSKHTFPISSDPLNQPPRLKSSKFDGILPVSFRRADAPGLPRFPGLGGGRSRSNWAPLPNTVGVKHPHRLPQPIWGVTRFVRAAERIVRGQLGGEVKESYGTLVGSENRWG